MTVLALLAASCNSGEKPVPNKTATASKAVKTPPSQNWSAPDSTKIRAGKTGEMIRYGKELLAHTGEYFGPNGKIAHLSNGMNCQNCHLDGGTRILANNYSAVAATYPKLSYRSGKMQPVSQRIKDCFNRSLAGSVPDTNGKEVQAMIVYIKWIGQGVKKGQKVAGTATEKLPFLTVAADPVKGQVVYAAKCKVCHGVNGEGIFTADKRTYTYPPLWGPHSYNDGAGMYRIGNLAGFVKNNMPFGATYKSPQLTNEEAWNVAAFINSQPRPHYDQRGDWRDLKNKPIDVPFGPYADGFSGKQHKYGPFGMMMKKKV
ncbi:MAG TPA: c-type cytochrome [Mucilaginibacter sp.]|nr:c-type cytochrome [Mucilaginibacter sp.]